MMQCREPGWCGAASVCADTVAVACEYDRALTILQNGRPVHTCHTSGNPHAIAAIMPGNGMSETSSAIAVAEGNMLSIWDCRCPDASACVQRQYIGRGCTLHALAQCQSQPHIVACGGSARGATILDMRKLRVLAMAHARKSDISSLLFLRGPSNRLCAAGLDQEVAIEQWRPGGHDQPRQEEQQGRSCFRGDARWLGVSQAHKSVLLGLCASGSIYRHCLDTRT